MHPAFAARLNSENERSPLALLVYSFGCNPRQRSQCWTVASEFSPLKLLLQLQFISIRERLNSENERLFDVKFHDNNYTVKHEYNDIITEQLNMNIMVLDFKYWYIELILFTGQESLLFISSKVSLFEFNIQRF